MGTGVHSTTPSFLARLGFGSFRTVFTSCFLFLWKPGITTVQDGAAGSSWDTLGRVDEEKEEDGKDEDCEVRIGLTKDGMSLI